MEKQEISNVATEKTFNKTTVFLSKMIFGENFDMMKKVGLVNSYTSDPEIMQILTLAENQRMLFLLFKNKKLTVNDIKKIVVDLAVVPVQVVFSYELVNDYSMILVDFPEKYTQDYDYFVKGMYSKFSESFQNKFPQTRDVFNKNNVRIGEEYTIYHHIFNKTNWLKQFWLDRLGLVTLDDKLELWESPGNEDLIFDLKTILK